MYSSFVVLLFSTGLCVSRGTLNYVWFFLAHFSSLFSTKSYSTRLDQYSSTNSRGSACSAVYYTRAGTPHTHSVTLLLLPLFKWRVTAERGGHATTPPVISILFLRMYIVVFVIIVKYYRVRKINAFCFNFRFFVFVYIKRT